jgi:hypothetical protein
VTIDEAKICLSIQLEVKHRLGKDYEAKALQLGIEALKRTKDYRRWKPHEQLDLLPGETEE